MILIKKVSKNIGGFILFFDNLIVRRVGVWILDISIWNTRKYQPIEL